MNNNLGTISMGVKCPIIREGDNLTKIVVDSILQSVQIEDNDVIGITESIVARNQGNYVTINQIVEELNTKVKNKKIALWMPIMSRNRFSLILRAFARYAKSLIILLDDEYDEQGNPTNRINPFTGIDVKDYYKQICEEENCDITFKSTLIYNHGYRPEDYGYTVIDARCHPSNDISNMTLCDICCDKTDEHGYSKYGLLGSNKSDEETLKLFPKDEEAQKLCETIKEEIKIQTGKNVFVMVYGDGCFKSPSCEGVSIWEFADPVTSPAYTDKLALESTPNEIKIKYLADNKYKELSGEALNEAINNEIEQHKQNELVGNMISEGTTPRRYVDLLASLMDLTSGSGQKGTPIIVVKNYFC